MIDDAIKEAIAQKQLPVKKSQLLGSLTDSNGRYIPQEGQTWDFKGQWPFSYSDDYFGAIARLICGFANAQGGLIIFGVHDAVRDAGHNKVTPNVDRLQQALHQLLSDAPETQCRRYNEGTRHAVDVLLVCPIDADKLPLRFTRPLGGYEAGVIWVRQNHEVVQAEPRHVASLYCRLSADVNLEDFALSGALPPSPATIKRFVGRLKTIDRIFAWLKQSDEPRTFLYGKGGSGKTTIAYEVAKVIKLAGSQIKMSGGEALDNVVFVSAKENMLDVMGQTVQKFVGLDFSNERELYEAILTLANWTSQPLNDLKIDGLKKEIVELFDLTSNFVVIDDIDTLTTKGIEAGFDFLYGVLWRSKRRSKILYTIRNAPTQSLANSIEVPGLEHGDYEEFVSVCCDQFKVHIPTPEFVQNTLSKISERRPLVIESILALRRTAGDYNRAVTLFEEGAGEDVRSYVFQREWNSLPADNYGRYILAVLALHGGPLTFADLTVLTRYEETRVQDALVEIREMFLQLNEVGTETTFQLGALTRAFVVEQSKRLDHYSALKARVEQYKRNFYPENPILSRLRDRVEALVTKGIRFKDSAALRDAYQLISDRDLSPRITEDARFISLQAYVCVSQIPPKIDDARRLFENVFAFKYEPELEYLKRWFFTERDSGHGLDQCIRIADVVFEGKRYSDDDKRDFLSRKASSLYYRGRNRMSFEPEAGLDDLENSLKLNLSCYSGNLIAGSTKTSVSEGYARSTAFFLFDFLGHHGKYEGLFRVIHSLCNSQNMNLDPIEDPLTRAFELLPRNRGARAEIQKIRGRLDHATKDLKEKSNWFDGTARERVVSAAASAHALIGSKVKELR